MIKSFDEYEEKLVLLETLTEPSDIEKINNEMIEFEEKEITCTIKEVSSRSNWNYF